MCVKNYCGSVLKNKKLILVFFTLVWLSNSVFAADELSSILTSAKENFGSDSTFIKLLYAAEIIAGGYAWHKTKHPSAVIGIVVLALFITFALKHWVFI
ncbi:Pilin (modular protein) [Gammaproteobacteria bacterium]